MRLRPKMLPDGATGAGAVGGPSLGGAPSPGSGTSVTSLEGAARGIAPAGVLAPSPASSSASRTIPASAEQQDDSEHGTGPAPAPVSVLHQRAGPLRR